MNKSGWLIALVIFSCTDSTSNSITSPEESQIPGGAIIENYSSIPGLQKATIKSGDVTIGEGDFLNGLYHGTWTSYGSDGRLQSITSYYEGKKQGVQLIFENTGFVQVKASYINDVLDGEYLVYDRRRVIERKNYVNGSLSGLQQRFYTDGTKMEEKYFQDGKIHGIARWYDEDGNLTIEYEYDMGNLISD